MLSGCNPVIRPLTAEELPALAGAVRGLYLDAGWIRPEETAESLLPMLRNSFTVMGAFLDGELAGMMRALSDGVSDAYLLDMVVRRDLRGRGIASAILEQLTSMLKARGIEWIVCISAPGAEHLYRKRGAVMKDHTPFRFQ